MDRVMSYVVSQRTREIGGRVALGARSRDVHLPMLRRALVVTLIGVGLGQAGAATAGLLEKFLVDVSPSDTVTLLSVTGRFAAVALLASWLPAHGAASVDPVRALRGE